MNKQSGQVNCSARKQNIYQKETGSKNEIRQQKSKNNIMDSYENLKNCSNDELMDMLSSEIQHQKEKGVFDYEALCNTIEKVKLYLPKDTYQNMLRIIDNLR